MLFFGLLLLYKSQPSVAEAEELEKRFIALGNTVEHPPEVFAVPAAVNKRAKQDDKEKHSDENAINDKASL